MRDTECVQFLQWVLPRMGYRWPGFRKVRGQVCKRIGRRLLELGLDDLQAYRHFLEGHGDEWQTLDGLCRITISRFRRDREVFRILATEVLPGLARQAQAQGLEAVEVWSAGCGAGEEPYSIAILDEALDDPVLSQMPLHILATDADGHQIRRAHTGVYSASSLRELSPVLRRRAFEPTEASSYRLRDGHRQSVELRQQDLRREMPDGPFHLILCRNLAFTYFDDAQQLQTLAGLMARLNAGGFLVIGSHEKLPPGASAPTPLARCPCILGPAPLESALCQ